MTRFATEQVPAQLLREGEALYDVTLDLIIAESEADELSAPVTRNIVRMDLAPGTVVENGQSRLVQPAPAGVHYGRNLLAEAHGR